MKKVNTFVAAIYLVAAFQPATAQVKDPKDAAVASVILEENDGRFTLGNGDRRLMYGYPVPLSTSHFVVKIDSIYITNSPDLGKYKGVHYVKGKTTLEGAYTIKAVTEYTYKKYTVKQTLIPVDKDLKEITQLNKFAQYYQTVLDVTNKSGANAKVGCLMLYDTMIEDNDNCVVGNGKRKFTTAQKFVAAAMPTSMFIFKDTTNANATVGELKPVIAGKKPDEMYLGNWPLLQGCIWNIPDEKGNPYFDSAVLLKWKDKEAGDGSTMTFTAAYGIPGNKISQLKALLHDPAVKTKKVSVYFDLGKADLDLNGEMVITDLLSATKNIVAVTLHGHSDAYGGSEGAMELSKKRIEIVKKYFDQKHITVIQKPHGNYESETTTNAVSKGNVRDRKVVIEIFYK